MSRLGRRFGLGGSFHAAFLALVRDLFRTVLEILVALEFFHQQIDSGLIQPCVGGIVDSDAVFLERLNNGSDRNIEVFRDFAYFYFRH